MSMKEEKVKYIKQIIWDYNISPEDVIEILEKHSSAKNGLTINNIYTRLLKSYNWYTLLKILDKQQLKEALSDEVLNKLYPKSLTEKYKYARKFL